MFTPSNSWADHWAVLLALRLCARLRDTLISFVLSATVSISVLTVLLSMLFDVPISEGFARVGRFFLAVTPDWLLCTGAILGVLAALSAIAGMVLLFWRGVKGVLHRT